MHGPGETIKKPSSPYIQSEPFFRGKRIFADLVAVRTSMSFRTKITLDFLGYDLLVYSVVGNPVFIHSLGAHICYLREDDHYHGKPSGLQIFNGGS